MAWFKMHQELARHPKLKRLARGLGISKPTAIGHLFLLWGWAMDYAPDGNLANFAPEDISDGAEWEGEAGALIDALLGCGGLGQAGFLDRDDNGSLRLHNWDKNCGADFEKRKKDAARKRSCRESVGCTQDVHATSAGRPADVRRERRGEEKRGEEIPPPTPPVWGGACAGAPSPPGSDTVPKAEHPEQSLPAEMPQKSGGARPNTDGKEAESPAAFGTFWAAYPRKVQKQTALKAWLALVKQGASNADVLNAAAAYQAATLRRGTPPDKIMHPATFLREARWRDWLPPDGASYREAMEARRESPRTAVLQAPMTYADAVERFRGAGAATVDLSPGEWREAPERGPAMEGTK